MANGRFGVYGGQYVPETLMSAVQELAWSYERWASVSPHRNRRAKWLPLPMASSSAAPLFGSSRNMDAIALSQFAQKIVEVLEK